MQGYDMGKRLVYSARSNSDTTSPLSIPELAAAGAFSAVPATLVAGPAERVKVLLQVCCPLYQHVHQNRGQADISGVGTRWKRIIFWTF